MSKIKNAKPFVIRDLRFAISRRGFTLVELIAVIAVTVVLMGTAVIFSRSGEKTLALARERGRLIETLLRAKGLAIATWIGGEGEGAPCAYGVHFEPPGGYVLFRDTPAPPASRCSENGTYAGDRAYAADETIERVTLEGITLEASGVSDILFFPPDPLTKILPGERRGALITLSRVSGGGSASVRVMDSGSVTAW